MIKEFNKLSIAEQVDFINNELNKDKKISVTKLLKKYGFNKSTVIGRFIDNGYQYDIDTRKYLKNTYMIQNNKNIEEVAATTEYLALSNKSLEEVAKELRQKDKKLNNNTDTDIKELLKYKNDIIEIVKEYKSSSSKVADNGLIIDTDIISDKVCNHNFKIYENVKKEIQELQEQYSHFRLVDLVSSALHEYYLKYKK